MKATKKIHMKFNTLELVPKGIAEINKRIETTTNDNKKERELIREIQGLKDSKPFII